MIRPSNCPCDTQSVLWLRETPSCIVHSHDMADGRSKTQFTIPITASTSAMGHQRHGDQDCCGRRHRDRPEGSSWLHVQQTSRPCVVSHIWVVAVSSLLSVTYVVQARNIATFVAFSYVQRRASSTNSLRDVLVLFVEEQTKLHAWFEVTHAAFVRRHHSRSPATRQPSTHAAIEASNARLRTKE